MRRFCVVFGIANLAWCCEAQAILSCSTTPNYDNLMLLEGPNGSPIRALTVVEYKSVLFVYRAPIGLEFRLGPDERKFTTLDERIPGVFDRPAESPPSVPVEVFLQEISIGWTNIPIVAKCSGGCF
jgi:hypothetical protein